jgi:hypothetical protein
MREFDLPVPVHRDPAAVVDRACAEAGLLVTMRGTLAAYPGCIHWHVKKEGLPGTLEITWWPKAGRLWIKVANNRDSSWIDAAVGELTRRIEG